MVQLQGCYGQVHGRLLLGCSMWLLWYFQTVARMLCNPICVVWCQGVERYLLGLSGWCYVVGKVLWTGAC